MYAGRRVGQCKVGKSSRSGDEKWGKCDSNRPAAISQMTHG